MANRLMVIDDEPEMLSLIKFTLERAGYEVGTCDNGRQAWDAIIGFKPDLLIWYYGFDTHRDDYGSLGLTEPAYFAICDLMLTAAGEMGVPLMVVLAGGSMSHLATATIPEIIRRLAEG